MLLVWWIKRNHQISTPHVLRCMFWQLLPNWLKLLGTGLHYAPITRGSSPNLRVFSEDSRMLRAVRHVREQGAVTWLPVIHVTAFKRAEASHRSVTLSGVNQATPQTPRAHHDPAGVYPKAQSSRCSGWRVVPLLWTSGRITSCPLHAVYRIFLSVESSRRVFRGTC